MRNCEIGIKDIGNIALAIDDFQKLANSFCQIGNGLVDLHKYWNEKIVKRSEKTWMTEHEYHMWSSIELHMVSQCWGSTACGWGGIGGAAMTSSVTIVIENTFYNIAAVYWNGKRAYIVEIDEKYKEIVKSGYHFPGLENCTKRLTVLQKSIK